jgi:hypothetical protein
MQKSSRQQMINNICMYPNAHNISVSYLRFMYISKPLDYTYDFEPNKGGRNDYARNLVNMFNDDQIDGRPPIE